MADGAGVVLVTGGSRGIGAATVRSAAGLGYGVCFSYVSCGDAAESLAHETGALAVQADIRHERDVLRLFAAVDSEFGRLGALVNNAGISGPRLAIREMTPDIMEDVFRINVMGAFLCAREAVRRMSKSNGGQGGAIVNVSSQAAVTGGNMLSAYAASKSAIATMTTSLCHELRGEDIRVNTVSPGIILTDQQDPSDVARLDAAKESVPLLRLGTAEEVAATIMWLLSPAASYINGANLPITGGR